jgi:hypothetical protein
VWFATLLAEALGGRSVVGELSSRDDKPAAAVEALRGGKSEACFVYGRRPAAAVEADNRPPGGRLLIPVEVFQWVAACGSYLRIGRRNRGAGKFAKVGKFAA